MMRWDIINHLIKENGYTTYLEIGYYKGWSFDRIDCYHKTAVDPNPSKTPSQEELEYGKRWGVTAFYEDSTSYKSEYVYKLTSDDFFKDKANWKGIDGKWDIIFIDGLHESQQVDRDIENALKHLSPGGVIVMHDCNPSSYEMTTTGTPSGEWTGDTYKSFISARKRHWLTHWGYTVNTDYGVGIFRERDKIVTGEAILLWGYPKWGEDWDSFQKEKEQSLGLVSPARFLELETKNHVKTTI